MSGAEDLVPCLKRVVDPAAGRGNLEPEDRFLRPPPPCTGIGRAPRVCLRIERWHNDATHEVHWRATTKDNITSIYGGSAASRIADPDNAHHVHEWLLEETFDATGNHIRYEYAKDNPQLYTHDDPSLDLPAIFDRNRTATQLYVRRIYYGNLPTPLDRDGNPVTYPDGTAIGHERDGRRYAFEVLFDYGDGIPTKRPHPDPVPAGQQELFGPDPSISAEQSGPGTGRSFLELPRRLDIRTLRRCRRVLMFHHFPNSAIPPWCDPPISPITNNPDTLVSFLTAVTVTGYQKDAAGAYQSASMPPVTFKYAEFRPAATALSVDRRERERYAAAGAEQSQFRPGGFVRRRPTGCAAQRSSRIPVLAKPRRWPAGSTPRHAHQIPPVSRSRNREWDSATWVVTARRSTGAFRSARGILRNHLRRHLADVQAL